MCCISQLGFKLHAEEKCAESASDFSRRAREKVRECKFSQGSNRRRAEVECSWDLERQRLWEEAEADGT